MFKKVQKWQKYFLYFGAICYMMSCTGRKRMMSADTSDRENDGSQKQSLAIHVHAIDLSEDMSVLSTKDDEILMLIYEVKEDFEIKEPIKQIAHRFTTNNRESIFEWSDDSEFVGKKVMIVLIEQDSDAKIEQIDPVVRVYAAQMIQALADQQYLEIEKYLEDDDLLGIKVIEDFKGAFETAVTFSGVYLFDRYEYEVKFKN